MCTTYCNENVNVYNFLLNVYLLVVHIVMLFLFSRKGVLQSQNFRLLTNKHHYYVLLLFHKEEKVDNVVFRKL